MSERFEVVVIGAGIAGASAAAALAEHKKVLLLERESRPGYHTTGRSAALLTPYYGNETVRALNLAGARWYERPPEGFCEAPLLGRRGALYVGRREDISLLEVEVESARAASGEMRRLDARAARAMVPILRPDWLGGAILDASAADMDVDAILQGFLRRLRRLGGALRTDAELLALERAGEGWRLGTSAGEITAAIVVDAAGAWADPVAALAGLAPLGIQPLRRTAIIVAPPEGLDPSGWPVVADLRETWYMKPEAGKLLLSPADEAPSEPCDAQAEELDVAICVDRVQEAVELPVRRIEHRWAGLRSFAPDRTPVAGFDPRAEGFFWLAGQGGYGIMAAPALAAITAHLVAGAPLPPWLGEVPVDRLAPARLLAAELP